MPSIRVRDYRDFVSDMLQEEPVVPDSTKRSNLMAYVTSFQPEDDTYPPDWDSWPETERITWLSVLSIDLKKSMPSMPSADVFQQALRKESLREALTYIDTSYAEAVKKHNELRKIAEMSRQEMYEKNPAEYFERYEPSKVQRFPVERWAAQNVRPIKKGDPVEVTSSGSVRVAKPGNMVIGVALEDAPTGGDKNGFVRVRV